MKISYEDRSALLLERVVVHASHDDEFGTRLYVSGPDDKRARDVVAERLGSDIEVTLCGDAPREVRPRGCYGQMEREPGRLQLRYYTQVDEHVSDIIVAEDDAQVIVFGTVCTPVGLPPGHEIGSAYHVYLTRRLGERTVVDAVEGVPVPYFNVFDGIEERVAQMRLAS